MAVYIAKGNYYSWAKYLQSQDGTTSGVYFTSISEIAFRWDGLKVALALDRPAGTYDLCYVIVVLNQDGTLYGAYRESTTLARAKISPNGMIFDSSNMITVGLDYSVDGTATKRQAIMTRFSVGTTTATTFNAQFYVVGGSTSSNSIS
jgi:hypothetical protein